MGPLLCGDKQSSSFARSIRQALGIELPRTVEKKITHYHEVNDRLRFLMRELDKAGIPYSKQKQALFDFFYKFIELNYQHISQLRDPSKRAYLQPDIRIPARFFEQKPLLEGKAIVDETGLITFAEAIVKRATKVVPVLRMPPRIKERVAERVVVEVPIFWLPLLEQNLQQLPARSLQVT